MNDPEALTNSATLHQFQIHPMHAVGKVGNVRRHPHRLIGKDRNRGGAVHERQPVLVALRKWLLHLNDSALGQPFDHHLRAWYIPSTVRVDAPLRGMARTKRRFLGRREHFFVGV